MAGLAGLAGLAGWPDGRSDRLPRLLGPARRLRRTAPLGEPLDPPALRRHAARELVEETGVSTPREPLTRWPLVRSEHGSVGVLHLAPPVPAGNRPRATRSCAPPIGHSARSPSSTGSP
ncbi:hypothetical protein [Kitasatospora sp. NPDC059599]|uniref:hypothetical protein n=1 Tax=Kitasatospora sp. NPDC059599 TaxID=3346880 RepID=UPI00369BEED1